MRDMNASLSRKTLILMRTFVGVSALLTPRLAARIFGVDPDSSSAWVTRLFGSRELALAGVLLAATPEQLPTVAALGAAIDTADVASSLVEHGRGSVSTYTLISGGVGAAVFAALGFDIVRRATQLASPTT